jgi:ribosomal protein S18 acetylase RimI-like enzyme
MAVHLRPITPPLVWEYKTVRLRALKDSPTSFGSTYLRESQLTDAEWVARAQNLNGIRGTAYLAQAGENYVGLALCLLDENDPKKAELISMWVAPEQRRLGVGHLLIDAITAWAGHQGARALHLMVTDVNHSAMDFYRSLGFSPTGHTEPYPNDPAIQEYEMSKPLG